MDNGRGDCGRERDSVDDRGGDDGGGSCCDVKDDVGDGNENRPFLRKYNLRLFSANGGLILFRVDTGAFATVVYSFSSYAIRIC